MALVRFLDRYGLAPAVLMEELPFYVGLYITNMASLQLQDVNHHLYNWGNVGMFAGMGVEERSAVVEKGQTRMKRFLPIGITIDERVCSGAHYARFMKDIRRYLSHPELLELPPDEVTFDQGYEYHEPKPRAAQLRNRHGTPRNEAHERFYMVCLSRLLRVDTAALPKAGIFGPGKPSSGAPQHRRGQPRPCLRPVLCGAVPSAVERDLVHR